jgi:hypothetical protein
MTPPATVVLTELWTSFASVLRSYCAAHGLNSTQQAVVEVSADVITIRVAKRWLRIEHVNGKGTMLGSEGSVEPFELQEDGTLRFPNGDVFDMDHAAERIARELMAKAAA